jgi:UDP-N-acetyl-D-galactosamine dehydrogenase
MILPSLSRDLKIAVVGLGYVGLPLVVEFSKFHHVVGFDLSHSRIVELNNGFDRTKELTLESVNQLQEENVILTGDPENIADCNVYVITVPTPVNLAKQPDLTSIKAASEMIGRYLNKNNIVIIESTVYPGVTEDICVPLLESSSGLILNSEFGIGYSPERINPGDKTRSLPDIIKVTSGSNEQVADFIDSLYLSIITAGTFKAESIKVAEAAKVIENTQRDINIALINELSLLFQKLNISSKSVLDAAKTKWNFLDFQPGLVGGHCIGVDPYYLTFKAAEVGHFAEIILAGRRINDGMPAEISKLIIKNLFSNSNILPNKMCVLIAGVTFKENCPDIRNTKVIDLYKNLSEFGLNIEIYDPVADSTVIEDEYKINLTNKDGLGHYDAIILAVPHLDIMTVWDELLYQHTNNGYQIFDLKSVLPKNNNTWHL